jgi:hypothetical protein
MTVTTDRRLRQARRTAKANKTKPEHMSLSDWIDTLEKAIATLRASCVPQDPREAFHFSTTIQDLEWDLYQAQKKTGATR